MRNGREKPVFSPWPVHDPSCCYSCLQDGLSPRLQITALQCWLVGWGSFQAQWVKLGWAAHNKDIGELDAHTPGSLENLGAAPCFIFTPGEWIQPKDHQIGCSPSERGLDQIPLDASAVSFPTKTNKIQMEPAEVCMCSHIKVLFWLAFCCSEEDHNQKQLGKRVSCPYMSWSNSSMEGSQGRGRSQDMKSGSEVEFMEEYCLLALHGLPSYLSYSTQTHPPCVGTTHGGRDLSISIIN